MADAVALSVLKIWKLYFYFAYFKLNVDFGAVHTKIDLSWIDLRSISVRFDKVFTLI